jgi:hypothetical protein
LIVSFPSCAITYYDEETGVAHIWGFGHMKMKAAAPFEECRAIVTGMQTFGAALGFGAQDYYIMLGWDNRRLLRILNKDTSVRLEWPSNDFFEVCVGSEPPKK